MKQDLQDYNDKVDNNEQSASSGGYSKPYKKIKNTSITGYVIAGVIGLITILLLCTLL